MSGDAALEPTLSEAIADYAIGLRYESLPPPVVHTAKRIVLDTIGCAIGGHDSGPARIAQQVATRFSSQPPATLLCTGQQTSHDLAVFANGVMIRYLDFNDGYISKGSGHPSDLLASTLTTAEVCGRSGRDLIAALVVGYEVFAHLADVIELRRLGLDHCTLLGLGAVVATSKLMGLTREQMVNAIGITVCGNTAVNQGRVGTLSNWKNYATSEASRKAVFAATLAQAGMTGPREVYEGRDGWMNVIHHAPFTVAPWDGVEPGIMRALTKRFPLGQYSQTVAQAAIEARAHFSSTDEIAEVHLHVSRSAIKVMAANEDKWRPKTHETADHSMPYSTGLALMYGDIRVEHYEAPYLQDEKLLALVARVKVHPSKEADRREGEINLCDLELVLKSGARHKLRVEYHRGHHKNPMTDAEMEEKFRGLAARHLEAARLDALLKQLWTLEAMPLAGKLIGMTRVK